MESAGKRKWKKQLEEFEAQKGMNMSSVGNQNEGTSSSKQKHKTTAPAAIEIMPQTLQFEGLSGIDCRKWWQETPNDHAVKASIKRAQVEWAIWMPVFCIRDYEDFLHTMIETYGKSSQWSTFECLDKDLVVSFKVVDFTRVFGIPGPQGKKVQPKKISEVKLFFIRLVCGDMTEAKQVALAETSKGRRLKKIDI